MSSSTLTSSTPAPPGQQCLDTGCGRGGPHAEATAAALRRDAAEPGRTMLRPLMAGAWRRRPA